MNELACLEKVALIQKAHTYKESRRWEKRERQRVGAPAALPGGQGRRKRAPGGGGLGGEPVTSSPLTSQSASLVSTQRVYARCTSDTCRLQSSTEMAASIAFSTRLHPQAWPGGTDISRAGAVMAPASRMANLTTLPEESGQLDRLAL
ncbi:hypothetical protein H112_08501 [Trichophyton rubrum D6]|uniref:Uncharacterized protein n=3 Tax=Trichophyton TaxID=5550 RepID=A0A080WGX4_TRIRC|nr:uncharacterized protein TERG_11675 [Trichophyton rubrum CBS 118892]EZF10314.1 hypothetical protein H100_08523 [Trichophyton rubrum MR850]EZF37206.1 hypothetical protein H102_08483 [Trichophyton rubrum CBS 100081]EZF47767.1 hypothetical protein H103_08504 [Trichophyton rubrum CBS 288.86]EZF58355.1 hypothetical protein H104_08457 [Trichophyton rubrum CBS 289.86]EZF68964.1 hypothetical protein H105_08511 [Trichophyton soudanense CBS 452.61]EZF79571.1 hypothetical protein H110_08507 [Trichophy